MAFTVHFAFAGTAGQTIHGQLLDNAFSTSGAAITSGITEVGNNGHYGYVASIADAFEGFIKFYVSGDTDNILAFFAITERELRNVTTAEVNTEADTALTDYDPPTKTEMDSAFSALSFPTEGSLADAVWDEVMEAGAPANVQTARQIIRVMIALMGGKTNVGSGSQFIARNTADTKDRVTATLDTDGYRTTVTLDGS